MATLHYRKWSVLDVVQLVAKKNGNVNCADLFVDGQNYYFF
jgi:hypothetical protein